MSLLITLILMKITITFFSQFLAHDTDFSSPLPRYEFQGVVSDVWLPIKVPKVSSQSKNQIILDTCINCNDLFSILTNKHLLT